MPKRLRVDDIYDLLNENPDITRREISQRLQMDYQNVCRLIDKYDLPVLCQTDRKRKKKERDQELAYVNVIDHSSGETKKSPIFRYQAEELGINFDELEKNE